MDTRAVLVIAVTLIMGWFALGILINLRRGNALVRWMQGGLPRIGERTTFRWLGSSVAELVIAQARRPLRRLETLVVLAPRDVPWVWVVTQLQGRRDTLILRAHLSSPPCVDLELADPTSWTGKLALEQAAGRGWKSQPYNWQGEAQGALQLVAPAGRLPLAQTTLAALEGLARDLSPRYSRFSLRREAPHLELHMPFPRPGEVDAALWFEKFQKLSQAITEQRA